MNSMSHQIGVIGWVFGTSPLQGDYWRSLSDEGGLAEGSSQHQTHQQSQQQQSQESHKNDEPQFTVEFVFGPIQTCFTP